MFGFSGGEILLIAFIALILFGNDKLPENMKKLLKGLNQAKKVASDVQQSWHEVKTDVQRSINLDLEKQELLELTKPVEFDYNMNIADIPHYEHPKDEIVPQDEIDDFHNSDQLCNENLNEQNTDIIKENTVTLQPTSAQEYLKSNHFVGPRI
ncbi:Sec-independent protein translocase subunit TatA/TatB [Fluviispira vulneris]|uniref:Sec-independent protein translocase subunit TatA/TatB n=1 Tax=Fluviispira vulneris TaxID=2763012 RepID=UPI001644C15E|nr:twin-arginine translocase TatA/TatE family subunit [Fluviispira vulneris]